MPKGLGVLIVVLLIIGIFFRFYNLDRKVYWHDEAYTSLRIAGYTTKELVQQVFDNQIIDREALQKYQRPNSEKNLGHTLNSLATEDPQHPPLYYAIARTWVQIFGYSPATIRSFSVLISLLVFPCVYWLCWELFGTPLVGWVAIALFAVSPFQLVYAQEAREYILWMVTILLSSAALLRAMRIKTKLSWVIYTVTVALQLYTFPFSLLVMAGHGIYVLATEGYRFSKTLMAYAVSSIAGLIAFLPWFMIISNNLSQAEEPTSWTTKKVNLLSLSKVWIGNISRIFFDVNIDSNDLVIYLIIIILTILILVGYSIYFLARKAPKRASVFMLLLIGITSITLILADLILGGRRSGVNRYQIPSYLGIELAVAYLLTSGMFGTLSSQTSQKIWKAIAAVLIAAGAISCAVSSQADTWWSKKDSHHNPQVARIINQANRPLLISSNNSTNIGNILSLSYLLKPETRLQLVVEPILPKIPKGFTDVFLFNPSKNLRKKLEKEQKSKIKPVKSDEFRLWKLTQ